MTIQIGNPFTYFWLVYITYIIDKSLAFFSQVRRFAGSQVRRFALCYRASELKGCLNEIRSLLCATGSVVLLHTARCIRSCAYPQADVPADVAAPKLPAASPYCPLWSISSTIGYIRYIEMPFRTKATAHMMSAVFADFFNFSAA